MAVKRRRQERGVAILMALVFLLIMTYIATEVTKDTSVEYLSAVNEINNVKAYYAAKSGMELSLLRIKIFQQVEASGVRKQLGPMGTMLDLIWQFPFSWPPDEMLTGALSSVDASQLKKTVKASKMDARFQTTILSEGSKIDINDLGSPSEALARFAAQQLRLIWTQKMQTDQAFQERFRDFRFEEVLNNIADWVDLDTNGRNGSNENGLYQQKFKSNLIPPNEPFKTAEELHLVAGMTDQFYDFLMSHCTVYGSKAVNVNQANREILMAIDPAIDVRLADEIIENRNRPNVGPFPDRAAFEAFLTSRGVNVERNRANWPPLNFDGEQFFRVKSRGQFGRASREIVAIVYDFDRVKSTIAPLVVPPTPTPGAGGGAAVGGGSNPTQPTPTPTPGSTAPQTSTGRPPVVYWIEN